MYVDPTGREPNKAQMGNVNYVTNNFDSLSAARSFYDNSVNHRNPEVTRYIHTTEYGDIDLYHFFDAADYSSVVGRTIGDETGTTATIIGKGVEAGGEGVEFVQWVCSGIVSVGGILEIETGEELQHQWKSANSWEDRSSNEAGIEFGKYLLQHPDKSFDENFEAFMNSVGAQEVNKEVWDSNPDQAPGWYNQLHDTDDPYQEPVERETFLEHYFGFTGFSFE